MAPRPEDYLQPGEETLADEGRHPVSAIDNILAMTVPLLIVIGVAFFLAQVGIDERFTPLVIAGVLLAGGAYIVGLAILFFRVRTSRYVVTNERVYRSHGRLRFELSQTTYDKVTDLQVSQSLFGRLGGFGTVNVQTAGTGLTMQGVRHPFEVKRRIEAAREAFIERLLEEYRPSIGDTGRDAETDIDTDAAAAWAGATDASGIPAGQAVGASRSDAGAVPSRSARDAPPLWRGGPVPMTLVGPTLFGIVFAAVGTTSLVIGLTSGLAPPLFGGAVMLFFALAQIGAAVVRFRYTRYEVARWGVVVTSGWLSRKRVETTYAKVTDVTTYQGIVGRIFDFGNITINTAGSNQAPVVFLGLGQPETVKEIINDARTTGARGQGRSDPSRAPGTGRNPPPPPPPPPPRPREAASRPSPAEGAREQTRGLAAREDP